MNPAMTTHELARKLLEQDDVPVGIVTIQRECTCGAQDIGPPSDWKDPVSFIPVTDVQQWENNTVRLQVIAD